MTNTEAETIETINAAHNAEMAAIAEMERKIILAIVEDALDEGCAVAYHDGEDYAAFSQLTGAHESDGEESAAIRENEIERIMREVHSTETAMLVFKKEGKNLGSVLLVYGNDGHDVISDHTDNPATNLLLKRANKIARKLSEK